MDRITVLATLTAVSVPALAAIVLCSSRSLQVALGQIGRAARLAKKELQGLRSAVDGSERPGDPLPAEGQRDGSRPSLEARCALPSCQRPLGSVVYIRDGRPYCDVACANGPAANRGTMAPLPDPGSLSAVE